MKSLLGLVHVLFCEEKNGFERVFNFSILGYFYKKCNACLWLKCNSSQCRKVWPNFIFIVKWLAAKKTGLALAPWIGLFGATTLSITAFSITTLSITTLSIMGLVTTLSINDIQHNSIECHYAVCRYAECHDYLNVMLNCWVSLCRNAECRYAECRSADCFKHPKT